MNPTYEYSYSVDKPLNREPPIKKLVSSFITPDSICYDRNHGPIPQLSTAKHCVRIDGLVKTPCSLSIDQLSRDYPSHEVVCALECAGNRRHTMRTLLKEVQGIDWGDGAVMNCKWKGPRVRDILLQTVGIERERFGNNIKKETGEEEGEEELHVAFSCHQVKCQDDDWFGGSVPLERCLREDGDVILALEMNDNPLSPNHGFPVRVVLPGIAGARWVKWLDQITIQDHESSNFYQQRDYKVLPPDAVDQASAAKYWPEVPAFYHMPINSVVAVPESNETIRLPPSSGSLEVKGYAVPHGDGGPVTRVEVSIDGGGNWVDASLEKDGKDDGSSQKKWCWVLWKVDVDIQVLGKGSGKEILSRATDRGGNTQTEHSQWNLRGVGYNGYGRARNLTFV